eukprot:TRINITY_DN7117_c1_g1_i4.p3 TRINITY_DN7117_c1_g1~~TRINITY_DN7117_c1_g1_i4.p3  ORF type:complete len:106 (-),score=22.67 TRINITY_DN7117_c1_g1_i4:1452-1769(-)
MEGMAPSPNFYLHAPVTHTLLGQVRSAARICVPLLSGTAYFKCALLSAAAAATDRAAAAAGSTVAAAAAASLSTAGPAALVSQAASPRNSDGCASSAHPNCCRPQ